jgi:hypothetical protein
MPNQIQAGTMMVHQSAILQSLKLESEPYFENWRSLGVLESAGLDRKVRTAGWSLFFMAGELRAVVPAWGGLFDRLNLAPILNVAGMCEDTAPMHGEPT